MTLLLRPKTWWEGLKRVSASASWDAPLERNGGKQDSSEPHVVAPRPNKEILRVSSPLLVSGKESVSGSVDSRSLDPRTTCVHPMCVKGLYFLTVLSGLAASGVLRVGGMRIYTSGDVEAVNGTDVRLKCTFESSSSINANAVVISWSFRPLKPGREESVFHYQLRPYPPLDGIFRKRVSWAGDVMGRDASIILQQVKFTYNGTYICQVKNPPDVHGAVGEVRLRVVTTASFSELLLLALAIGGGIAGVVLLLIVIVSCRRCKKRARGQREGSEEAPRKERKDPTACHPSRSVHLYLSETSIEIDSSDGMISDASTKSESSSEDEGPSSDERRTPTPTEDVGTGRETDRLMGPPTSGRRGPRSRALIQHSAQERETQNAKKVTLYRVWTGMEAKAESVSFVGDPRVST
ncbi:LOW QUALITY PROTEIN: uncharacterized protein AB9W97_008689 [Spinachia spinachia]